MKKNTPIRTVTTKNLDPWSWAIFAFVIWLFFSIPAFYAYEDFSVKSWGELVSAEVIGVKVEENYDDDRWSYYTYLPTFRFECHGQMIEKEATRYSTEYNYPVGTVKGIYYSSKSDRIAVDPSFIDLIFLGITLILLVVWIRGFIKRVKWKREVTRLKEIGKTEECYLSSFRVEGTIFTVYLDPDNPENYYIDFSSAKKNEMGSEPPSSPLLERGGYPR